MLINFEPSCWCLFSISTEFYYIEASALKKKKKGKCGEGYATNDCGMSLG